MKFRMVSICMYAAMLAVMAAGAWPANAVVQAEQPSATNITVGSDHPLPPWADATSATDEGPQSGGPSTGSFVYLGSGVYHYGPDFDADVYNPTGPRAQFLRLYRTSHAANGASSPGLPVGWTHGYDNTITAEPGGGWLKLSLNWYNGAKEELTPEVKDGALTGTMTAPKKPPYIVTGKASTAQGRWEWIMISFADTDKWTFGPDQTNPDTYRLRRISENIGKPIDFYYDQSGRISQITQSDGKPLIKFEYDASGLLSLISPMNAEGKPYGKVKYFYGQAAGTVNLTGVSEIGTPDKPFWRYGYVAVGGKPFLNAVGMPNPSGAEGLAVAYVEYDPCGRVSCLVDANTNRRCYTYGAGQTKVDVSGPGSGKTGTAGTAKPPM